MRGILAPGGRLRRAEYMELKYFCIFGLKIWYYVDNVLILWLKGMRNGGMELQPCLSRYILRAVYCFFSTQLHRAVARKQLLKRCYFHLIFQSETWPLNCDVKMVDSSTYIVGILMLHASGASMLYRCGAVVLSVEWYTKA